MADTPVPPPRPPGTPPRPEKVPFAVVRANPVTKAPKGRTKSFRVRGRYGPPELVFISEILKDLGYTRTRSNDFWDIMWTVRMFKEEYQLLKPWQKVNFMPGLRFICSKNLLHSGLVAARHYWITNIPAPTSDDKTELEFYRDCIELAQCPFWPTGFNLEDPLQFEELANIFREHEEQKKVDPERQLIYIIKKPFSSCGRGVNLISTLDELLEIKQQDEYLPLDKHKPLAQEYIANVKLLDGFKYTMRIYVSLTGVDPLAVYIHKNGLLRICSKKYTLDEESMKDEFIHIDSIAINKLNERAERLSDDLPHDGLRCEVSTYLELLCTREGYSSEKVEELWEQIRDIVALSILSSEKDITGAVTGSCTQRSHAFEILGYDILVDEDLKPWLLEINHTPSLEPFTELENQVKRTMLTDLFQLVDITAERKLIVRAMVDRVWSIIQILQEDIKAGITPECLLQNPTLAAFDLLQFDKSFVWIIANLELEGENRGGFELVLPTSKYIPFSEDTSRNHLAAKWMSSGLSVQRDIFLPEDNESENDDEKTMGKKAVKKENVEPVEEEFNDSDYEDKYPDDLPSDSELKEMVTGDATTFGVASLVIVLLIGVLAYVWWAYLA